MGKSIVCDFRILMAQGPAQDPLFKCPNLEKKCFFLQGDIQPGKIGHHFHSQIFFDKGRAGRKEVVTSRDWSCLLFWSELLGNRESRICSWRTRELEFKVGLLKD